MRRTFAVAFAAAAVLASLAAAADERDSDRRVDRDREGWRYRPHQHGTYPQGVTRTGEPNPYEPKVGAPNPYATQGGAPNPYATQGGTPNAYGTRGGDPARTGGAQPRR